MAKLLAKKAELGENAKINLKIPKGFFFKKINLN